MLEHTGERRAGGLREQVVSQSGVRFVLNDHIPIHYGTKVLIAGFQLLSVPPPEIRFEKQCDRYALRALGFQTNHPVMEALSKVTE